MEAYEDPLHRSQSLDDTRIQMSTTLPAGISMYIRDVIDFDLFLCSDDICWLVPREWKVRRYPSRYLRWGDLFTELGHIIQKKKSSLWKVFKGKVRTL